MQTIQAILESRLQAAVQQIRASWPEHVASTEITDGGKTHRAFFPRSGTFEEPNQRMLQGTSNAAFGDYQTNVAMQLAKARRANPRALAQEIVERIDVADLSEKPEIAGAGFINFRIKPQAWTAQFTQLADDSRLGVPDIAPRRMVIDFSSPNVAKPMHVGHIRSTILGDALARVGRFVGHAVITDNHIGDWGTQFGILCLAWKTILNKEALERDAISELERIYKELNKKCKEDPATLDAARQELVKLQNGDEENLGIWREMLRLSQDQFDSIYKRLDIHFDHALGESFYNPWLKDVVEELKAKGIAKESEGAICVFSDGTLPEKEDPFLIRDENGVKPAPALVQKADGASNYTTTDLATIAYRVREFAPDEIVYVTDGRQQLHFRQLFNIWGRWHPDTKLRLAHVWFGAILGEDGKPIKTREGGSVKLVDLLNEAEERALAVVNEKNPALPEAERREIARVIGLGAVKYVDLQSNRQSDYIFSWDRMLSFQGNTAPYLQNAYVRIRSIFRKAAEAGVTMSGGAPLFTEAAEFTLVKKLAQFGEVLPLVLDDHRPNILCTYLFELANTYHAFYEECPVLKAEEPARSSRLKLSEVTSKVLKQGLSLLGIEVPERM